VEGLVASPHGGPDVAELKAMDLIAFP